MKILKLWACQEWDGGERHNTRFYMDNKESADEWKATNKHNLVLSLSYEIYSSMDDLKDNSASAIRQRALKKLTPEERHILGFK